MSELWTAVFSCENGHISSGRQIREFLPTVKKEPKYRQSACSLCPKRAEAVAILSPAIAYAIEAAACDLVRALGGKLMTLEEVPQSGKPYTVIIGYETLDSTVDWVEAPTTEEAVRRAFAQGEGREEGWPVAIFEGHLTDIRGDLGRPKA